MMFINRQCILNLQILLLKHGIKKVCCRCFFVTWQELLIVSHEHLLPRWQFYAVRGIILDWFVLPQETEDGI